MKSAEEMMTGSVDFDLVVAGCRRACQGVSHPTVDRYVGARAAGLTGQGWWPPGRLEAV